MFLLLATLAFAEDRWAVAPTDAVRWLDSDTVSVRLAEGDRVEVLIRDGERVRVRKGVEFGWVAASALTDVEPVAPPAVGLGAGGFPGFNLTTSEGEPLSPASAPAP
jgi:hypothetical protein